MRQVAHAGDNATINQRQTVIDTKGLGIGVAAAATGASIVAAVERRLERQDRAASSATTEPVIPQSTGNQPVRPPTP